MERNVELAPWMYDEFYGKLHRRYWHKRLTRLIEKKIDVALVKEFYSNVYDPEDGSPKTCMVRGRTIRFDTQTLNGFLGMPVAFAEGEQLSTYSQYLYTYPDFEAIATKLCTPGGQFLLNIEKAPWKILWKDLTTSA